MAVLFDSKLSAANSSEKDFSFSCSLSSVVMAMSSDRYSLPGNISSLPIRRRVKRTLAAGRDAAGRLLSIATNPPRLSTENNANNYKKESTWWLRDGRYLRLKTIELGYSLPKNTLRKVGLSNLRFYFSGLNLLCFSSFNLWDPEMGDNGLGYPLQRVYNIGVQFDF